MAYGPSFGQQRVAPNVMQAGQRRRMAAQDPRIKFLQALRTLPQVTTEQNPGDGSDQGGQPAGAGNPFTNLQATARLHANPNAAFMRATRPGQPQGDGQPFDQSDPAQAAIHLARSLALLPPAAAAGMGTALQAGSPLLPAGVPPQILAMIAAQRNQRTAQLQQLLGGG